MLANSILDKNIAPKVGDRLLAANRGGFSSSGYLKPALILWTVALLGVLWFVLDTGHQTSENRLYIIPWAVALGIITLAPAVYFLLWSKFDLFHPLVFPVWTYFFPGFAIGGLILAAGISQAHYISYIQDETYNLPLTFVYLIVGFLGIVAGFAVPFAKKIGSGISKRLPAWELSDQSARNGGVILLCLGLLNVSIAFVVGALGFQTPEEGSNLAGLSLMSTLFWYQASFLLGLFIFRSERIRSSTLMILGVLVVTAITNALLVGSRGGLFHFILPILFAYFYSGRKIGFRQYATIGVIMLFLLAAGIIYGTAFRNIRETQQSVSLDRYVAVVPTTFSQILEQDPIVVLSEGITTLASRVELVSAVAVVVSNYEVLAPYEEELGISNNIMVETFTFFIPRIIWNDKPTSVEPAKYADLYFNFSENAFSMTPIGDLIRNFGPWGIPVGMLILGMILRVVYTVLVDGQGFSYWKLTLYYLLLTSISYDGTYGGIVPNMVKTAFVGIVGFAIVWLITVRLNPAAKS